MLREVEEPRSEESEEPEVDSVDSLLCAGAGSGSGSGSGAAVEVVFETVEVPGSAAVSYTHLTLPTNREV